MGKDKETCDNGRTKSIRKISFPISWVWIIILAVVSAVAGILGLFSTAKASGDRANYRVDSIEKRFDQFERIQMHQCDKLDKIILELSK